MAETSEGWDGTVDEAGIARILAAAAPPRLSGFTVAAVAGQRRVICSAGQSHYAFIRYQTDEGKVFDFPTPSEGRWHLLVQRRDWANNTVTAVTIPGPDTPATLIPGSPPLAYPAGFADSPGIAADIPIAWVWVRATDTVTVVVPLALAFGTRLESSEQGLVQVRPTAVTGNGVSLASDGTIVFTNVSNTMVDIFGLFSSRFRNYRMQSRITSKAAIGIDCQLINGSNPVASNAHFNTIQALVNTVRQDSYSGANEWLINLLSLFTGAQGGSTIEIYTPNEPERTTFHGNVFATGGVMSNAVVMDSLETADVATGLRIRFPAGAAVTGTLKFYGYA